MISAGEFIQASGTWVNDRTHGVQFRASFLKATADGIEKYLGSGMIRGIGPVYAKKLVRAFGEADGRRCVFLAGLCRAERKIAAKLTTLAAGRPPWPLIDAGKAIPWVEKRTKLALANSQQEAIRGALWSKVLVITGGPGVGKTTLVNSILEIFLAKTVAIVLCAPTGRAAKRLSESTGLEAKTIHRLLETDPRTGAFRRTGQAPLDCDLLVVDEISMVDVPLMRALLRALPDQAAFRLVGDVDQLPSVGPGQVPADIISSGAVPVVRLTEVFRQAAESRIIVNADRIDQGLMPDLAPVLWRAAISTSSRRRTRKTVPVHSISSFRRR
jgi:exodeoxyribonuclease V alpha subunit